MKRSNDDLSHTGFDSFCYFKQNTTFQLQLQLDPFPSYSENKLRFTSSCCTRSNRWRYVFPPETGNRPSFRNFVRSNRQQTAHKPCTPTRSKMNICHDYFCALPVIYHRLLLKTLLTSLVHIYLSTLLAKFCSQQSVKTLFWLNGSKERVGGGNLSLYTPRRHIREVEVHFHLFLTSKQDTGGGLPRNEPPFNQWMRR